MSHNPITYSLNNLRMMIPYEILEKTFLALNNTQQRFRLPLSLDSAIRDKVIEGKVMVDCNLVGGTSTYIPLLNIPATRIDNFTIVYQIPKSMTQNRSITRALSVAYGFGSPVGGNNMGLRNSSALLDAAGGVVASQAPIPDVSTAYVQLIGENTVMVQDNMSLPTNIALRCWLENDSNFNHLNPASYPDFAKLVELATKAYIYTLNVVAMDRAYLQGGQDLNAYRNIIEGYSDAAQNYQDFFQNSWRKVALLNDYQSFRRHLSLVTGGQW